ncbi:MAG: tetraacyldisaccharide 4'-kinase [Bdellovibrionota bacterium]|nr:MAG: tetraacyldisaccharide 4'-kinase [Pseudomonadota bacterium]
MNYPPLWLRILLWPLSYLYQGVVRIRRNWYERGFFSSFPLSGTVISIGNIEAGGTGKSPLTLELCRILKEQGAKPVILTRGYKSGLSSDESSVLLDQKVILQPQNTVNFVADEARMQAALLKDVPIILGRDRYSAAKRYLENFPNPTHWILDDGFQHQRIKRDIDIVLLDAKRPLDNGHCLPAGLLRESQHALKKADWVIFTRSETGYPDQEIKEYLNGFRVPWSSVAFLSGSPAPIRSDLPAWQSIPSWTLALGVAKPDRVESGIRHLGLNVAHRITVADHEIFDKKSLAECLKSSDALLTTEKDYWREKQYFDLLDKPVYLIPLSITWQEGPSFPEILRFLTENLRTK